MAGPIKITFLGDTKDLDRALGDAEGSMRSAAAEADKSANKIESSFKEAGAGFTRVTEHADAAATRFSILGGAVGDVSGGIETFGSKLGLSEGAIGGITAASEGLSTALMFGAGVADIMAVSTELMNGATLKGTALKIKDTVVTKAKAAGEIIANGATKAMAAGQWALNAAMTANPIGIVVVAIAALVGGLVIAYKKSETFRKIVNSAFGAVKRVASPVISWLASAVPRGFEVVVRAVTFLPSKIIAFGGKFLGAGKALMGKIFEGFKKVGSIGADIGRNLFNGVVSGINKAIDGVNNFLPDKIGLKGLPDIDLPNNPIPHIPKLARGGIVVAGDNASGIEAIVPLERAGDFGFGGQGNVTNVYVTVNAPVGSNPVEIGRQLRRYLDSFDGLSVGGSRA